ncbi:MAG TPA: [FeFe] hydrogenase H-cluster radical SAM maturase HydE [Bacteroidales bacterium]|nr:[FeFe] hydrogenase H-cluster radical SAM maturase HydE [Bacteroidales bacterium]
MTQNITNILEKPHFNKQDLITLLSAGKEEAAPVYAKAAEIKKEFVGNKVYFRGLIEYSNYCTKNCYYCGIRAGNHRYQRYELSDEEVLEAARYAYDNKFASIVIQSGERSDPGFVGRIEHLLREIQKMAKWELHITLSLGEQSEETYRRWFHAGAHRYLLRIEVSNPELYKKLHPSDQRHEYARRLEALKMLRAAGYQVGTGVMIGLPFQTVADLADDLIFFREFDIDMVGMGPYVEHEDTPLFQFRDQLLPHLERAELSFRMVALLRIMMKDINIAATTAMQTLDPQGREKALQAGANVIMPNLTPVRYLDNYLLYQDKPNVHDEPEETRKSLEEHIRRAGETIGYGEWGDSRHFSERTGCGLE